VPVSNPSYFPDQRGNGSVIGITAGRDALGANNFLALSNAGNNSDVADLIVIGNGSGGGGMVDPLLDGTVIIGGEMLPVLVSTTGLRPTTFPVVAIGSNMATNLTELDSAVWVGSDLFNGLGLTAGAKASTLVVIGHQIYSTANPSQNAQSSVLIGVNIQGSQTGDSSVQSSVLIGIDMFQGAADTVTSGCLLMGNGIFISSNVTGELNGTIALGNGIELPLASSNNVLIGVQVGSSDQTGTTNSNVGIGNEVKFTGNFNVAIGSQASVPNNGAAGSAIGCVLIGTKAGTTVSDTAGLTNLLVIESSTTAAGGGNVPSALVYGQFTSGNVILGNSVDGTNRDFAGVGATNIVKLLDGTAGGTDPIGGGYFYVTAGVLHWVATDGTDTTVSSPAAPATGASTALFGVSATNKPGSTTGAGPVAWENRVIDGVSYQSPLWAT
jgi:hypothetical protein